MLTYGLSVVYMLLGVLGETSLITLVRLLLLMYNLYYKHGSNATLVKDKCWMHIGTKLTLGYSWIYVEEYYEFLSMQQA